MQLCMLCPLPWYRYSNWTSHRSWISLRIIVVFINNRSWEKLTIVKYRPFVAINYLSYQHSAAKSFPISGEMLDQKIRSYRKGRLPSGAGDKWQRLVLNASEWNEGCCKFIVFCIRTDADQSSSSMRSPRKPALLCEIVLSSYLEPSFQFCVNLQKNQYPSQCCTFLNSCGFPRISAKGK